MIATPQVPQQHFFPSSPIKKSQGNGNSIWNAYFLFPGQTSAGLNQIPELPSNGNINWTMLMGMRQQSHQVTSSQQVILGSELPAFSPLNSPPQSPSLIPLNHHQVTPSGMAIVQPPLSPTLMGIQQGATLSAEHTNQMLYKTELCRSFTETGNCRYGNKCQFAHGMHELVPISRHPKYKTETCKTFHTTGTCPYGTRCRFIHTAPAPKPNKYIWATTWDLGILNSNVAMDDSTIASFIDDPDHLPLVPPPNKKRLPVFQGLCPCN